MWGSWECLPRLTRIPANILAGNSRTSCKMPSKALNWQAVPNALAGRGLVSEQSVDGAGGACNL
ncbi:unnamed protein product [Prunus armeniaca]